jgi:DNA-binding transcriptional LysR family regulator
MEARQNHHIDRELDLHHLQIFDVLLQERSLTRAARVLNLTQPALSKTLAKLRHCFDDPLFVRVGLRMEPTPKALNLAESVQGILERMRALRNECTIFDPKTSDRKFSFFMVDAAVVQMLPIILNYLQNEAPNVHVQAVHCDISHLDLWLESGIVDFAIGSFPSLMHGIRRQLLWHETYAAVVRSDHPRVGPEPSLETFVNEKHALVTTAGTGHEHQSIERVLEGHVSRHNIVCKVPTFAGAAYIARNSDVVATLPRTMAETVASELNLRVVQPPLDLPVVDISQYWHERYHKDAGNQWLRGVFRTLFLRN